MGKPGVRLADASIRSANPTNRARSARSVGEVRMDRRSICPKVGHIDGSDRRPSLVRQAGLDLWKQPQAGN